MQELEKALKELNRGKVTFEMLGRDVDFVSLDWADEVIRKYTSYGWIPVEERLPETSAKYLVSSDGVILYCQYSVVHKAFNVYDHFKRWQIKKTKIDADARMPMPESYQVEDGEESKEDHETDARWKEHIRSRFERVD